LIVHRIANGERPDAIAEHVVPESEALRAIGGQHG